MRLGKGGGCRNGNDNDTEDIGGTCRIGFCESRAIDHGKTGRCNGE